MNQLIWQLTVNRTWLECLVVDGVHISPHIRPPIVEVLRRGHVMYVTNVRYMCVSHLALKPPIMGS